MVLDGGQARQLDYETDVLSRMDWRGVDPENIATRIPENAQAADTQLRRIRLTEDGELLVGETVAESGEALAFDPAHAVRMMLDIVPNSFVGREIVGWLLDALRQRGFDDRKLGGIARLVVEEMRMESEVQPNVGVDKSCHQSSTGPSSLSRPSVSWPRMSAPFGRASP